MVTRLLGDRAHDAGRGVREALLQHAAATLAADMQAIPPHTVALGTLVDTGRPMVATISDVQTGAARLRWRAAMAQSRLADRLSRSAEHGARAAIARLDRTAY